MDGETIGAVIAILTAKEGAAPFVKEAWSNWKQRKRERAADQVAQEGARQAKLGTESQEINIGEKLAGMAYAQSDRLEREAKEERERATKATGDAREAVARADRLEREAAAAREEARRAEEQAARRIAESHAREQHCQELVNTVRAQLAAYIRNRHQGTEPASLADLEVKTEDLYVAAGPTPVPWPAGPIVDAIPSDPPENTTSLPPRRSIAASAGYTPRRPPK